MCRGQVGVRGPPAIAAGAEWKENTLEQRQALERFLAGVERRAFRMAGIATGNTDDALDIVQDAMFKLVQRYADRGEDEWGPLFHRILQSRIYDWYRRSRVRGRWRLHLRSDAEGQEADPIQQQPDPGTTDPGRLTELGQATEALDTALRALSLRQQQAFLLRAWEGLDVAATARAMGCSQGSVKTHYSRAVHALRTKLGDHRE